MLSKEKEQDFFDFRSDASQVMVQEGASLLSIHSPFSDGSDKLGEGEPTLLFGKKSPTLVSAF